MGKISETWLSCSSHAIAILRNGGFFAFSEGTFFRLGNKFDDEPARGIG
jgi:hypothetical protein